MSRTVRQVALASCLGAIAVAMAPHAAFASAFGLREESAEGLGNAFAGGAAIADSAATAYYNPAGMSLLKDNEIDATATWISPDVRFSGSNSNPLYGAVPGEGPNVSGISGGNVVKPAAIGSVFGVWKVNDKLSAGVTFAVPYGERVEYKENFVGRYQALASDLTDYEASFVLSYKLLDNFEIGGGVRVDYLEGRLSQALNVSAIGLQVAQGLGNGAQQYGAGAQQAAAGAQAAAAGAAQAAAAGNTVLAQQLQAQAQTYAAQAQQAQAAAQALAAQAQGMQTMSLGWAAAGSDGLAKVTGDDYGVGYTLGAIWEFDPVTRIGFNYRSKIFHDLSGNSQIQLPGNASQAPTQFTSLLPANQNASLKLTLPDSANVSFYHELNDQWAILASAEWTGWSSLNTLNVIGAGGSTISSTPENWNDTYYLAAGVNWKPIERWTFHFGTAYDQAPMGASNRTARIPDADRYWLSGGVSYAVTPKSDVHFGYAHLFTPGGSVSDSSGLAQGGGVLSGTYQDSVDIVSASFAMRF